MTGQSPYCLYHGLREDFVPLGGGEAFPPPFPSRLQAVLYAFGEYEFKTLARLAGAKLPEDQPKRRVRQEEDKQP